MGRIPPHPAVFVRVANTGVRGYRTWKSAYLKENRGVAEWVFAGKIAGGKMSGNGGE